ncbi:MAG: ABC-three component system protein [Fusobacteriaceae bacterium]
MERRKLSVNEERQLLTEVGRICPKCYGDLLYKKPDGEIGKLYEIAHIYPINITSEQEKILKDVEILGNDLNDLENLILLCRHCHKAFDNPRKRDEYIEMVNLKKKLMQNINILTLYSTYNIEKKIEEMLRKMSQEDTLETETINLDYVAKEIKNKIGDTNKFFINKIKYNVTEYYSLVRRILLELDEDKTMFSENLSCQIKSAYIKFYSISKNKEKTFEYLSDWLNKKNGEKYGEESQILISYFVQNCEVF